MSRFHKAYHHSHKKLLSSPVNSLLTSYRNSRISPLALNPSPLSINITYTYSLQVTETWIKKHICDTNSSIIGIDLETRPNFRKGARNPVATLQLCAHTPNSTIFEVLVSQVVCINHSKTRINFPLLYSVLENPGILKTGVGLSGDIKELERDFEGLKISGAYELEQDSSVCWYMCDLLDFIDEGGHIDGIFLPRDNGNCKIPKGLKTMTEEYCGLIIKKSKSLTMYNWQICPLPEKQINYAAIDAFAGLLVYHELQRHLSILSNKIGLTQASIKGMWKEGVDEARRLRREEVLERRKREVENKSLLGKRPRDE